MQMIEIPKIDTCWKRLFVVISGVKPLLLHDRLAMQRQEEWQKTRKRTDEKVPPPELEAEWGVLRDPETGAILLRADALLESAKQGAKEVPMKRPGSRRTTNAVSIVSSGINLVADAFPLLRPPEPLTPETVDALLPQATLITDYAIDIRRVMVQRAGVMRARPRIDLPWACVAEFECDVGIGKEQTYLPEIFAKALAYAGELYGIGDYRVGKGGIFGRFQVVRVWIE